MTGRRLPRRLVQLFLGLALYGVSIAALVLADLGVMPWDVLHQGIARQLGWSLGTIIIAVGVLVLLAWIPLRERPGIGTVANVVVVGLVADAVLAVVDAPSALPVRIALAAGGVLINAVATAAYVGVRLGPGPRDGLMTGLVRRTGWKVGPVRTGIEVLAVVSGWLLGGSVGIATVAYALAIGPLVQPLLPRLTVPARQPGPAGRRRRPNAAARSSEATATLPDEGE